jgi:hypothetical protein
MLDVNGQAFTGYGHVSDMSSDFGFDGMHRDGFADGFGEEWRVRINIDMSK